MLLITRWGLVIASGAFYVPSRCSLCHLQEKVLRCKGMWKTLG